MSNGLYLVDFHAHLQGPGGMGNLCPGDQQSAFFRHAVPFLEQVAHLSEPVHDQLLRHLALNYRDALSRFVYGSFGKLGLMEALRLFKRYDLPKLLSSMDSLGIAHVVICSLEPLTMTQELIELTGAHKHRISIFASVSRDEPDPIKYLTPFVDSGAIAGLKIHPVVGGYACGELYHKTKDLAALASETGLPIVIHTGHIPVEQLNGIAGCNEVRAIEPLIAGFPKVKFVLAHIGWESWRQVLGLAKQYPNALVETSWQPARIIRRAVDVLGPERVLFGSDYPLFKQSLALRQVRQALTAREFVLVASVNALRLLRLSRPAQEKRVV